jgi:hypothetical protein
MQSFWGILDAQVDLHSRTKEWSVSDEPPASATCQGPVGITATMAGTGHIAATAVAP